MTNYNLNDSFQKLLGEIYYRYRGCRSENLPNGNVLVWSIFEMTKQEFHDMVDLRYRILEKSIHSVK